jgi:hypothetical protein
MVFLARNPPIHPRHAVDALEVLSHGSQPLINGPERLLIDPESRHEFVDLSLEALPVPVIGKREGNSTNAPVGQYLRQRPGVAAITFQNRYYGFDVRLPDDPVDALYPVAHTLWKPFLLSQCNVVKRVRMGHEDIVEVAGPATRGKKDFNRDRCGEANDVVTIHAFVLAGGIDAF